MFSVSEVIQELGKIDSLFSLEETVIRQMRAYFGQLMGAYFEAMDQKLAYSVHDQFVNQDTRTINFLFGPVTFKRRRYRDKDGNYYFALDQLLKIEARKRLSPYFVSVLAELGQMTTLRNTAEFVNLLTLTDVSPWTVSEAIRKASEKVAAEREIKEAQVFKKQDQRRVPVLFVEGDAFLLKERGAGKKELHHFHIYEGVKRVGKRRIAINDLDFIGFDQFEVVERMNQYLRNRYDLSDTVIFLGSDAGPGYGADRMLHLISGGRRQHFVLDRYHLLKKIETTLGMTNELTFKAVTAVRKYDFKRLEMILDTYEANIENTKQMDQLDRLRAYLIRNWAYIKHPKHRTEAYRQIPNLGSAESSHRAFTYRMKKQGKSWSFTGMNAVTVLIEARINGCLHSRLKAGFDKQLELQVKPEPEVVIANFKISRAQPKFNGHLGVRQGIIGNLAPKTSALGALSKAFKSI